MSALLFLASDKPFKEQPNPHEKIISINEALALGAEIPDYALELDLDRDKPILLYMDRKIHFNKETKELDDGDLEDVAGGSLMLLGTLGAVAAIFAGLYYVGDYVNTGRWARW